MAKSTKKNKVKIEPEGQAHIQASFNNIIISITNNKGQVISWSSAGKMGFKGAKVAIDLGLKRVKVFVKGPGAGRESAIRSIHNTGLLVSEIVDVTPLPHNGCRPPNKRRV